MDYDLLPTKKNHSGKSRKRRAFKWFGLLVASAVLLGIGVIVGRGGFELNLAHAKLDLHFRLGNLTAPAGRSTGSTALDYSSVDSVYRLLQANFDGKLDTKKILEGLKSGLVTAAGDPYTTYFDPQAAANFESQLTGSFTGIGAELGTDAKNNIVIVSPLAGYPAEKAGLKPKDIILKVDGKSAIGMSVDAVVQKIRGPAGTSVTLTISRAGKAPFDVTITRAKITIPSVDYKVDGSIGYIRIKEFNNDTFPLAKKAVAEFQSKKVKGVVLDLRDDPGGYLDAAVDISSLWLNSGQKVVEERRGSEVLDTKYATGDNPLLGMPTVVLINEGSASASEIVSGALHDNHVATLVGVKSFGKGSVQQVEKLNAGDEVKITIARWYTPGGKNIDKQGIEPDVQVKLETADIQAKKDPQKDKAYQLLEQKF